MKSKTLSLATKTDIAEQYLTKWFTESKVKQQLENTHQKISETVVALFEQLHPEISNLPETPQKIFLSNSSNFKCILFDPKTNRYSTENITQFDTRHIYVRHISKNGLIEIDYTFLLRSLNTRPTKLPRVLEYILNNFKNQLNAESIKPTTVPHIRPNNKLYNQIRKLQIKAGKLQNITEEKTRTVCTVLNSVRTTKQLSELTDAFEEFYPSSSTTQLPIPVDVIKSLKPIETVKI